MRVWVRVLVQRYFFGPKGLNLLVKDVGLSAVDEWFKVLHWRESKQTKTKTIPGLPPGLGNL